MVQDLSRTEEQRGWRKAYIWGISGAGIVALVIVSGLFFMDYYTPDRAGMESMTETPLDVTDDTQHQTVSAATISTRETAEFGTYLTDGFGRPIYLFKADQQGTNQAPAISKCYEACAKAWPPVLSAGAPKAEGQVENDSLGTTERRNGATQVTYNGWPLYLFARDVGPGKPTGQDVEDFGAEWYLIRPSGEEVHAADDVG